MEQKLKKAFSNVKYESNIDLPEIVWKNILLRDKRITRLKLWVFSIIGLASFIAIIPMFRIMSADLAQSGFYEYLSLAFSSGGLILTYWKDFLSSLAESLPIMSITYSLTLVLVFFLSLKYAMRQIIKSTRMSGGDQLSLSF